MEKGYRLIVMAAIAAMAVALVCAVALAITVSKLGLEGGSHPSSEVIDADDPHFTQFLIETFLDKIPTSNLGIYSRAAVSADGKPCGDMAKKILEMRGTVVDAAIAALVCSGAVNTHSMGLGGGFFMTIYSRSGGEAFFLNAREVAPAKASVDLYLNNTDSPLTIAIPGEILGYFEAKRRFGNSSIAMETLFKPTIEMCQNGFRISRSLGRAIQAKESLIRGDPGLSSVFLNPATKEILVEGNIIKMERLAGTLKAIAQGGSDVFYKGELGRKAIQEIKDMGGVMDNEDLEQYRVQMMTPFIADLKFNGYRIVTSPPPGSGAVVAGIIRLLAGLNLTSNSDPKIYKKFLETLKFNYAMRNKIGDPSYPEAKISMEKMTKKISSEDWRQKTINKINRMGRTVTDPSIYEDELSAAPEDGGTSHISILGENGDAVSVTSTINTYFGSGIMSPSTGIIWNNEMNDFGFDMTKPNVYGLYPSQQNVVKPGKMPASSMAPSIVLDEKNNVKMVIGASGGTTIPSSISYVIMQHLMLGLDIKMAIDYPRLHHQLLPMVAMKEAGFSSIIQKYLKQVVGHEIKEFDPYLGKGYAGSRVQAISVDTDSGIITANNDRRKEGQVSGY